MGERKTSFWYGRVDYGYIQRFELTVSGGYRLLDATDRASLAEEAADDYHSEHDGWEAAWPITLALAETEDGPELERFEVDREARPVFTARRIPTPKENDRA